MSFESELFGVLNAAGVTALVGERLRPGIADEDSDRPYVVWSRIFSERQNTLAGFTSGLERVRVQVDCYADTFDGAVALATAVKAAIDASSSTTLKILVTNEQDFYEDAPGLHRRMLELSCIHKS